MYGAAAVYLHQDGVRGSIHTCCSASADQLHEVIVLDWTWAAGVRGRAWCLEIPSKQFQGFCDRRPA